MKSFVLASHRDNTKSDLEDPDNDVLRPKTGEIVFTLEHRVSHVDELKDNEEPEEPSSPRVEIVPVPVVAVEVGWKEQGAEQVQSDRKQDDKRVDLKASCIEAFEAELPPPPENRREEHVEHPGEVDPIGPTRFGLLDEPRRSLKEVRDSKAYDD
jgi:hypothetical protein